ncbi:MAG: putative CRISPR-associated protein [Chthonomonadales bacterium]|nr:putative CRISPR-associated protein [Chthonomonadales bacterium]
MAEIRRFSFDLARQPCVPVLDMEGKPQTLSLRDTLVRAHELKEIQHDSPVVSAALVRLCVALLTDIYPLDRPSQWPPIWTGKAFDQIVIDAYFEKYGDRFDLFHEQYPFYQCAALEDDQPINLNLLACELASGNNPTLFDHSLDTVETDYAPERAFHLLLAVQSFALAGLLRRTTRLKGETEPLYWQSAYGGALIPGAMIWLTGDNLFETLCLNLAPLVKLDSEADEDLEETTADRPIWRQDHPETLRDRQVKGKIDKISPHGTRDRLTFQSRLIRLLPQWHDGKIVVRRAAFNHGRSLEAGTQHSFDPMLAYRPSKKEGWLVTRLSAERAAWRDAHTLIGLNEWSGGQQRVTPRALHLLHESLANKVAGLEFNRVLRLNVAGLANDQAKILLWRHDRLDAPAQVLCDREMAARVGALLTDAEEIAYTLRTTTRRLCALFLAPCSVDARGKSIDGALPPDPDRVTALADAVDTRATYWARLESAFHCLLLRLGEAPNLASEEWKDMVQKEARLAFDEVVVSLGDSVQACKAVALVRPFFLVPSRQTKAASWRKTGSKSKEVTV